MAAAGSLGLGCASRAPSSAAVAESSGRTVQAPLRFGWLSSQRASGPLPSGVALGSRTAGRVLLFFEFAALGEPRSLLRAELRLFTAGTPGHAVDIELSRAEAVRGELRAWSDQPRALYPRLAARLEAEQRPARLDVTELVRAETKPGEALRVLLRAEPSAAEAVLVETGTASGMAPTLEAYWQ